MSPESPQNRADSGPPSSLDAELANKHCIFQAGDSHGAISAAFVREVTHAPTLVKVPRCPPSLAGLCHIRSEFIPVVVLGPLLGDRETLRQDPEQLLVLDSQLGPWALMIDRVIAIDAIETHVDAGHRVESQRSPLLGTATYQSFIVRVLDPHALLQLVQQSRHSPWNPSQEFASAPTELFA